MPGRLEGKVALVTGAARGVGRSTAVRLASEGAAILAADICEQIDGVPIPLASSHDLIETAALVEQQGARVHTAMADVRDFESLDAAVSEGVAELGGLDIVVANAGIGNGGVTIDQIDDRDWAELIDINLGGVWKTVKASTRHLVAGGRGGSIVMISSVGGLKAYPLMGAYVAAKHGVVGLMRASAVELGEHSIRVNSVHPTYVNTPMFMNEGTMRSFRPDLDAPGPEDMAEISKMMHILPVGWVEPDDVANAVLFLASDDSRYVTGVALPVDAGSCLK